MDKSKARLESNVVAYHIRKCYELGVAATGYFLFGLGILLIGVFFRLLSPLPILSPAIKQRMIRWCIHKGCLAFITILRVFGLVRYTYDLGAAMDEKSGLIIIANHPSLIDAVFLFAANKNLSCLVKSAVWDNFFTGAVARLAGFIPNNSLAAVPMAVDKLRQGENLLIFPEGTRSEKNNINRFKRGASNIAVAANAPILPVLIQCDPPVLKKGDKWYIIPYGGASYSFTAHDALRLEDCIDTSKARTLQYRALTQFLESYYLRWLQQHVDVNENP